MTAPAMTRKSAFDAVEAILTARAALDRAEEAWRQAVQDAAGNHGDWGDARQAGEACHQARAALKEAEDHR